MRLDISNVVSELRTARDAGRSAVELADLCRVLLGSAFGPISYLAAFTEAFDIPFRTLRRSQTWRGFNDQGETLSDEEFEALLRPWLRSGE